MGWRLAKSLEQLRSQVNAQWPNRSKSSDGSIGDEGHSSRTSDHNPDPGGVVRAIDITHDPKNGFDSYAFADMLLRRQDKRLKYVISNRRIGSGPAGPQPGVWRKYTGSNPHDHHVHISAVAGTGGDSTAAWSIDMVPGAMPPAFLMAPAAPVTLRKGSTGAAVRDLQERLGLTVDGIFGDGTEHAVKAAQIKAKIVADGIVGPQTWKIIPPKKPVMTTADSAKAVGVASVAAATATGVQQGWGFGTWAMLLAAVMVAAALIAGGVWWWRRRQTASARAAAEAAALAAVDAAVTIPVRPKAARKPRKAKAKAKAPTKRKSPQRKAA
jgi:hypothetical protein